MYYLVILSPISRQVVSKSWTRVGRHKADLIRPACCLLLYYSQRTLDESKKIQGCCPESRAGRGALNCSTRPSLSLTGV